jgi:hypothetical protein
VFLHAVRPEELWELSPSYGADLHRLQLSFRELVQIPHDEYPVLVFRLAYAEPASVRSRRRSLEAART